MTTNRFSALRRAALAMAAALWAGAVGAAPAPQLREMERKHAQYRLSVTVEAVIPTARGGSGRLDTCKVRARVKRLLHVRTPAVPLTQRVPAETPRPGALIRTQVRCWAYDNRVLQPLVGQRIYYGGPERFIHLEVWGSFVNGRFVIFDFVNRDGA